MRGEEDWASEATRGEGTGCWRWALGGCWLAAAREPEAEQHLGRVCVVLPLPVPHHPSKAPLTPTHKRGCSVPPALAPKSIPQPSSELGLPWPGPRGHIYHRLNV